MQVKPDKLQNAKLTPSDVIGLRKRVRTGETTTAQEADRFGVGVETIRRAVRGETFRNVREGLPSDEAPMVGRKVAESEILESAKRLEGLIDESKSPVDDFLRERGQGAQLREEKPK